MTDNPSYVWGIASYHRADRQPMLTMLHKMGYPATQIVLATQTEADYKEYSERYGEMATVIFREAHNVSENKNTVLDYIETTFGAETRVVMCSDKVRAINKWMRDGKLHPITDGREMDAFIKRAFFVTKQLGGSIFGIYSVENTFFMSHDISLNQQILGCFMGIAKAGLQRFDPYLPLKEDFGFSLQHIAGGGRVVRFNDLCMTATLHTKGGCHEAWNSDGDKVNADCTHYLLATYPALVKPHATRKNEIRYVGPTAKINQSILDF